MASTFFDAARSTAVAALAAATVATGCQAPEEQSLYGARPTAALNEEFHDGGLAFAVTRVELSQPKIGSRTAEGTFVVVSLRVRNMGDWPQSVYCQNQRLTDLRGRTYDNAVSVGAGEDTDNIKPGKQVDVQCAFDVPVGTLAGAVEVHDQPYSGGVTVKVLSAG